eukprot:5055885-Amphidinium_carterae.6
MWVKVTQYLTFRFKTCTVLRSGHFFISLLFAVCSPCLYRSCTVHLEREEKCSFDLGCCCEASLAMVTPRDEDFCACPCSHLTHTHTPQLDDDQVWPGHRAAQKGTYQK